MADQVRDLHAAIMNLPCNVPPMVVDDQAYKLGHRDASHAAAELAASHAADVEALRSALEAVTYDKSFCCLKERNQEAVRAALKGDKP